jgi:hypothetical protein
MSLNQNVLNANIKEMKNTVNILKNNKRPGVPGHIINYLISSWPH